jgi:DNA recombination-dependent growth factor C
MAAIRRSGGIVAWFWSGRLPAWEGDAFSKALARHRFRSIEDAASEEVSVGWVTPADPTGSSFDAEDMQGGPGLWLRMRVDKKALPKAWLQIHRDGTEKACGKKLSGKERRELRDDLMSKLLPRVLPTVKLVDALLLPERSTVLLFATSKALGEAFGKLFFATFSLPLVQADPYQMAHRAGLADEMLGALDRAQAVPWPRAEGAPPPLRRVPMEREPEALAEAEEAT